jgi:hypothetical protein
MRAFHNLSQPPPVAFVAPNYYDQLLYSDYATMELLRRSGGLQAICCPASYSGQDPPWVVMPPGGQRFQKMGNVSIMSTTENVETTVVEYRVPTGHNGVIVSHLNMVQATNQLEEASGTLTWRIKQNRRYIPDYGEITTTLGSLQSPNYLYRGGFRLEPQQIIRYTVTLATGAQAALGQGRIICGLYGWYYPLT